MDYNTKIVLSMLKGPDVSASYQTPTTCIDTD